MNHRAETAFINLPEAIDQFEKGIYYPVSTTVETSMKFSGHMGVDPISDPSFADLRKDLSSLIYHYTGLGYFTQEEEEGLHKQLQSPDRENWLIAFTIIDNQKHKLCQRKPSV